MLPFARMLKGWCFFFNSLNCLICVSILTLFSTFQCHISALWNKHVASFWGHVVCGKDPFSGPTLWICPRFSLLICLIKTSSRDILLYKPTAILTNISLLCITTYSFTVINKWIIFIITIRYVYQFLWCKDKY